MVRYFPRVSEGNQNGPEEENRIGGGDVQVRNLR